MVILYRPAINHNSRQDIQEAVEPFSFSGVCTWNKNPLRNVLFFFTVQIVSVKTKADACYPQFNGGCAVCRFQMADSSPQGDSTPYVMEEAETASVSIGLNERNNEALISSLKIISEDNPWERASVGASWRDFYLFFIFCISAWRGCRLLLIRAELDSSTAVGCHWEYFLAVSIRTIAIPHMLRCQNSLLTPADGQTLQRVLDIHLKVHVMRMLVLHTNRIIQGLPVMFFFFSQCSPFEKRFKHLPSRFFFFSTNNRRGWQTCTPPSWLALKRLSTDAPH